MIHRAALLALATLLLQLGSECRASVILSFDLGAATVSALAATFDVNLSFTGDPGDRLEAIQLSVIGSSAALTAGGSDYSRFAFATDSTSPLSSWSTAGILSASGVELLFPLDPVLGPFILPSSSPRKLGALTIDLSGIPAGTSLSVTLANGTPGLRTDAGGVLGGAPVFSAAGDPNTTLSFEDPNGVSFSTPADSMTVPEPTSIWIWGLMGMVGVLCSFGGQHRSKILARSN